MKKALFLFISLIISTFGYTQFGKYYTIKDAYSFGGISTFADVDLDGNLDVFGNKIFIQKGNMVFKLHSSNVSQFSICRDVDLDGDSDVIANNIILKNNFPSPFQVDHYFNCSPSCSYNYINIGDVNNNGYNEYIYLKRKTGQNDRIVCIQDSAGTIGLEKVIVDTSANYMKSIQVVDVDNDGLKDIIYTDLSSTKWRKNFGNWKFSGELFHSTSLDPKHQLVHLDNNSDLDFASDNAFHLNYSVSPTTINYGVSILPGRKKVKDYDKDGDFDVFYYQSDTIYLLINNNNSSFTKKAIYWDENIKLIDVGDVNNDGSLNEILCSNINSTDIVQFNTVSFSIDTVIIVNFHLQLTNNIVCGDINNNGENELLVNSGHKFFEFDSLKNGIYDAHQVKLFIDSLDLSKQGLFGRTKSIDLNNDNYDDLSVIYGKNEILFYHGNALGKFINPTKISFPAWCNNCLEASYYMDIDNDNDLDCIIVVSDSLFLYQYSGGNFQKMPSIKLNTYKGGEKNSAFGDINNDGVLDFLLPADSNIGIYLGGIGFSFAQGYLFHVSNNYNLGKIGTGDVSGDSIDDIIIIADSLITFINDSNGTTFKRRPYPFISSYPGGVPNTLTPIYVTDIDNNGYKDIIHGTTHLNDSNKVFYQYNGLQQQIGSLLLDFDFDGDLDKLYYVVGSSNGVSLSENYFSNKYKINGKVFYDSNQNKILDAGDYNYPNIKIQNISEHYTAFSDSSGSISLEGKLYQNLIRASIDTSVWSITTDSLNYNVYLDNINPVKGPYYFGFYPKYPLKGVNPIITSSHTRCSSSSKISVNVTNNGTVVLDTLLIEVVIHDSLSILSTSITPDSINFNKVYWSVNNLLPNNSFKVDIITQNPSVSFIGKTLTSYLNVYSHNSSVNKLFSTDTVKRTLTCGYDPNFKEVKPEGIGSEHYVSKHDTLHYTLHFQNTGNDTAINILLVDKLSPFLDINSLNLIGASHNVNVTTEPDRDILFRFKNIYLPDSGTNEIASHGYVRFSVAIDSSVNANEKIENYVDIYFDLNPAITTNKVFNTIECFSFPNIPIIQGASTKLWVQNSNYSVQWYFNDTIIIGANSDTLYPNKSGNYTVVVTDQYNCSSTSNYYPHFIVSANEKNNALFKVYPNPFRDKIVIENINFDYSEMLNIQVFDVMGKEILYTQINPNKNRSSISLEDISDGIYFITISLENKVLFYDKLIAK